MKDNIPKEVGRNLNNSKEIGENGKVKGPNTAECRLKPI
jgi:hypothetical protein